MALLTADQLAKLKEAGIKVPGVNQDCIGCSACVAIAPEVFELDDEGKSVVIAADTYNEEEVETSIGACPVNAIYWE